MKGFVTHPKQCIVMECVPHGTLHSFLKLEPEVALEWNMVLKIALDVARGMAFMHRMSPPILHRDLKSPNILVRAALLFIHSLHSLLYAIVIIINDISSLLDDGCYSGCSSSSKSS